MGSGVAAGVRAWMLDQGRPEGVKYATCSTYFGTYSVSEADNVIRCHIDGSTNPNWQGTDEERLFKLSGDELTLTNSPASLGAGTACSVWKAVK